MKNSIKEIILHRADTREMATQQKEIDKLENKREKHIPSDEEQTQKDLEELTKKANYFAAKTIETEKEFKDKRVAYFNLEKKWGKQDWKEYKQLCQDIGIINLSKRGLHVRYKEKSNIYQETSLVVGGAGVFIDVVAGIFAIKESKADDKMYIEIGWAGIAGTMLVAAATTTTYTDFTSKANDLQEDVKGLKKAFEDIYKK